MGSWRDGYKRPNPERDKEVRNARDRKKRLEMRMWFDRIKSSTPCIKCDTRHPAVITFHHRDPGTKISEVAEMVSSAPRYSKEQILAEIAKCDALCSNCHLILHWEERNLS